MSAFDEVKAEARRVLGEAPIERHALFRALEADALSAAEIRGLALQIHHVVDRFPLLLAALISNIPDWRLRMPLVDNLHEEHGHMDPARVHVVTYRAFLAALDVGDEAIAASRPCTAVVAYVHAVRDLCLHRPFAEGLGALGVIEEIVARASPIVARKFAGAPVGHFADHQVLDLTHSDEIYALAAEVWPHDRAAVARGLALGAYYHRRLYSDLLEDSRRGPEHSR